MWDTINMSIVDRINDFISKQHANIPGLMWDPISHRHKKPESMISSTKFPAKPEVYQSGGYWNLQIGKRHFQFKNKYEVNDWLHEHASDDFSKAVRVGSREEAEAYGIKLPPEKVEQKPAPIIAPKSKKKISNPPLKTDEKLKPKKKMPDVIQEIGRGISPKGPGYRSPEDIAADIEESKRVSGKIKDFLNRKKED